ncbi:MAG: hypothetical protein GY888_31345 [Planctomycetaceae bacterium]|nr:hypothetical protein [Planctomycetaceae bacterium]
MQGQLVLTMCRLPKLADWQPDPKGRHLNAMDHCPEGRYQYHWCRPRRLGP